LAKIVIKLGKFLFPAKPEPKTLKGYAETLKSLHRKGHRIVVITGGGETARNYISAMRKIGVDENLCDEMGIAASRVNAKLFASILGESAHPKVPLSLEELKVCFQSELVIVMGGLTPGHSTMAVGALAAEAVNADLYIIASDVDGIYSSDPKKNPKAKKFEEISTAKALDMALKRSLWAGTYQLDPLALKIIERSQLVAVFLDGRNRKNIVAAVSGRKAGTRIIPLAR
jgi:uridylate kinase